MKTQLVSIKLLSLGAVLVLFANKSELFGQALEQVDAERPVITSITGGKKLIVLEWTSRPDSTYIVCRTTDLKEWIVLDDGVPSGGTTTSFEDTAPVGICQFYKVSVRPKRPPLANRGWKPSRTRLAGIKYYYYPRSFTTLPTDQTPTTIVQTGEVVECTVHVITTENDPDAEPFDGVSTQTWRERYRHYSGSKISKPRGSTAAPKVKSLGKYRTTSFKLDEAAKPIESGLH